MVAALLVALVTPALLPTHAAAQPPDRDREAAAAALRSCVETTRSAGVDPREAARRCLNELEGFDAGVFHLCWADDGRPVSIPERTVQRCLLESVDAWRPPAERPTTDRDVPLIPLPNRSPGGDAADAPGSGGRPTDRDDPGGLVAVTPEEVLPDGYPVGEGRGVNRLSLVILAVAAVMVAAGSYVVVQDRREGRRRRATARAGAPPPPAVYEPTAARDRAQLVAALLELRDRVPSEALRAEITLRLAKVGIDSTAAAPLPGVPALAAAADRPQLVGALLDLHDLVPDDELRGRITEHLASVGVEPVTPASGEPFDPSSQRGVQAAPAPTKELDGTVDTCDRPGWSDRGTQLRPPEVVVNRWSEP